VLGTYCVKLDLEKWTVTFSATN